jgi:hypothetical protein
MGGEADALAWRDRRLPECAHDHDRAFVVGRQLHVKHGVVPVVATSDHPSEWGSVAVGGVDCDLLGADQHGHLALGAYRFAMPPRGELAEGSVDDRVVDHPID